MFYTHITQLMTHATNVYMAADDIAIMLLTILQMVINRHIAECN